MCDKERHVEGKKDKKERKVVIVKDRESNENEKINIHPCMRSGIEKLAREKVRKKMQRWRQNKEVLAVCTKCLFSVVAVRFF